MAEWSKLFPELKKTHRQHNNNKNLHTNKNNPWYNNVHPWKNNEKKITSKNYNLSRNNDGGRNNENNDYEDSLPNGVYLDVGR